jgi:hypothetical protein
MDLEDEAQEMFATQEKRLEEEQKKGRGYKKELEAEKKRSKQKDQALAQKDQAMIDCVLGFHELGAGVEKIMEKTRLSRDDIQAIVEQKV